MFALFMIEHNKKLTTFTVDEEKKFSCPDCGRRYSHFGSVGQHRRYECGKDPQFMCPLCSYVSKRKCNMKRHLFHRHYLNI